MKYTEGTGQRSILAHRGTSEKRRWAWAAALLGVAGALSSPASADYYYSGGKKQFLNASTKWMAFQVQPNQSGAVLRGVQSEAAVKTGQDVMRYGRSNLVVLPIDGTPAQQQQLRSRLNRSTAVSRVVRVYDNGKMPIVDNGEVAVRFRSGVSLAQAQEIVAQNGGTIVRAMGNYAPNGYIVRLNDTQSTSSAAVAARLYETAPVIFANPDFLVKAEPNATVNDPYYPRQWHLREVTNGTGTVNANVNAEGAWTETKGSPNIIIAVLDDGFDLEHEDFKPTVFGSKIVPGYDFIDNDNDPRSARENDDHGTSVAGVATANGDNGVGVSGMAPFCRLMPIRLVGALLPFSTYAEAFYFATRNGADVINNSWGFPGSIALPDTIKASFDYATRQGRGGKGSVILFSAGNNGREFGNEGADENGVNSYPKVITVGASNSREQFSVYSEPGSSVDVVAPSNDIRAGTLGITTTDRTGEKGYNKEKNVDANGVPNGNDNNYTDDFGGTSSACPLVSGVVALLLSNEPGLSYSEVRQRLIETADKIDPNNASGDFYAAYDETGHSRAYGFGRVNAASAIQGSPSNITIVTPMDRATVDGVYPVTATTVNTGRVESVSFLRRPIIATMERNDVNKAIPDFNLTGANDEFVVTEEIASQQAAITVTAQIKHGFMGDIEIVLITPDGERNTIYDHGGGPQRELTITATLPLQTRKITGTYRLQVIDDTQEDVGTLVSWNATVSGPWTAIGEPLTAPDSDGIWRTMWDVRSLPSGKYEVGAQAKERALSNGVQRLNTDVNSGITITGAAAQTFSISGRIKTKEGKGVAGVSVSRGLETTTTNSNGDYSFRGLTVGKFVITPTKVGSVFTPTSKEITVGNVEFPDVKEVDFVLQSTDKTAPTLAITKPNLRAAYRSFPVAVGTAADEGGSKLAAVTGLLIRDKTATTPLAYYAGKNEAGDLVWSGVYDAAQEMTAKGTATWSVLMPELPEGNYSFRATARDNAGNIARSSVVGFTIDRTAPTVSISSPKAGSNHLSTASVLVAGNATDQSGISKVTYRVTFQENSKAKVKFLANVTAATPVFDTTYTVRRNELLATGTTGWRATLSKLAAGNYTVRATAHDKAGNAMASSVVAFTVKAAVTKTRSRNSISSGAVNTTQSTLTLSFASAPSDAADAAQYVVTVNGQSVEVESVSVLGNRVTLGLPEGSLRRGDGVEVTWSGGSYYAIAP
jgi:subtilisin family serine protease/subtilisin-like proprotein convertase family protein